jgi:hypothetical protein
MPAVPAAAGVTGAEVVAVVATVVWAAAGACDCVHPATSKPAIMQAIKMTKIPVLDIMIIPDIISGLQIKRSSE